MSDRDKIYDVLNNGDNQLIIAAKRLLFIKPNSFKLGFPKGWDRDKWNEIWELPLKDRIKIAIHYLNRELDRMEEIEKRKL